MEGTVARGGGAFDAAAGVGLEGGRGICVAFIVATLGVGQDGIAVASLKVGEEVAGAANILKGLHGVGRSDAAVHHLEGDTRGFATLVGGQLPGDHGIGDAFVGDGEIGHRVAVTLRGKTAGIAPRGLLVAAVGSYPSMVCGVGVQLGEDGGRRFEGIVHSLCVGGVVDCSHAHGIAGSSTASIHPADGGAFVGLAAAHHLGALRTTACAGHLDYDVVNVGRVATAVCPAEGHEAFDIGTHGVGVELIFCPGIAVALETDERDEGGQVRSVGHHTRLEGRRAVAADVGPEADMQLVEGRGNLGSGDEVGLRGRVGVHLVAAAAAVGGGADIGVGVVGLQRGPAVGTVAAAAGVALEGLAPGQRDIGTGSAEHLGGNAALALAAANGTDTKGVLAGGG